jgi:DNA polymerase-1
VGADGRIHSTFNQTETRTGRISSGEPNLQNIPVRTELGSRFRKYFIAPQGETLPDADYSQIELRLLAHISGDEAMCEAFRSGADIHRSTAARIYGLPPEQVTPALRSSAKAVTSASCTASARSACPRISASASRKPTRSSKNYFANFPGVKKYLDETVEQGRENGYVTTLYAAAARCRACQQQFQRAQPGRAHGHEHPHPGTAADIIKLAMVRVYRRLKAEGLRAPHSAGARRADRRMSG